MLRHILAMILVAALGSLQAAHARISPDFLQALEMLQEFYDAGSTLADGAAAAAAGPMAVDDDVVEALHKKLELVSRHRVQRRVPPFPIKTARAFSPDLAVRERFGASTATFSRPIRPRSISIRKSGRGFARSATAGGRPAMSYSPCKRLLRGSSRIR